LIFSLLSVLAESSALIFVPMVFVSFRSKIVSNTFLDPFFHCHETAKEHFFSNVLCHGSTKFFPLGIVLIG